VFGLADVEASFDVKAAPELKTPVDRSSDRHSSPDNPGSVDETQKDYRS
jgi:hypothetical protein